MQAQNERVHQAFPENPFDILVGTLLDANTLGLSMIIAFFELHCQSITSRLHGNAYRNRRDGILESGNALGFLEHVNRRRHENALEGNLMET